MKLWILAAILVVECALIYEYWQRRWFKNPKTKDLDIGWFWVGWLFACLMEMIGTAALYWALFLR